MGAFSRTRDEEEDDNHGDVFFALLLFPKTNHDLLKFLFNFFLFVMLLVLLGRGESIAYIFSVQFLCVYIIG